MTVDADSIVKMVIQSQNGSDKFQWRCKKIKDICKEDYAWNPSLSACESKKKQMRDWQLLK